MRKYKLPYPPNYKEPYFARYIKSWRKPPKYIPGKIKVKPLQHCKVCTHTCEYYAYTDYEKSYMCPYYNMQ